MPRTFLVLLAASLAGAPLVLAQQPAAKSAAKAKDAYPNACVDCHVAAKGNKPDIRLGVAMAKWTESVEPKLLEAAKAASVDPAKVKGKHPKAANALKSIPSGCMFCHKKDSKVAPPFARLLHLVHVGEDHGECVDCHKLDAKTGIWKIPSGAEK